MVQQQQQDEEQKSISEKLSEVYIYGLGREGGGCVLLFVTLEGQAVCTK